MGDQPSETTTGVPGGGGSSHRVRPSHPDHASERGRPVDSNRTALATGSPSGPAERAVALGGGECEDGQRGAVRVVPGAARPKRNDGRKASIDFTLYVHTDPGPATSTVWWNGGGPGPSETRNAGFFPGYVVVT